MKNLIKSFGLVALACLVFIACDKEDDSQNNDGTSADQVAAIAANGAWSITYFYDTDEDETANFSGYTFTFNANGAVIATNGSDTVDGVWSVIDSSSNSSSDDDGNSTDDDDFNLFFDVPATSDFEDLNDDWDIIEVTANKIELIDISGGNGGTDYLTFTKN